MRIKDSIREEVYTPTKGEKMRKKIKNFLIKSLIWLKNSNPLTRGMIIITGQVRDEVYDPKTKKTVKGDYAIQLLSLGGASFGAFNTIQNALKYALARWIGASNATAFIGANSLATQATFATRDGICENTTGYAYTTTKDSGGTGAEDNIVFKGVRTAAGAETHAGLQLGLAIIASPIECTTVYASQTVSKTLASSQVYTVYWTLTIS